MIAALVAGNRPVVPRVLVKLLFVDDLISVGPSKDSIPAGATVEQIAARAPEEPVEVFFAEQLFVARAVVVPQLGHLLGYDHSHGGVTAATLPFGTRRVGDAELLPDEPA